jgi:hypothetical protein
MCKPDGEADIPAECPRRGDCRGCPMLPSAMAGEGIAARLDAPAACVGLPGDVPQIRESMPIPKKQEPL